MTYMPNIIFSCQTTLKKVKFLEFGLKMPTWQPCTEGGKQGLKAAQPDFTLVRVLNLLRRLCVLVAYQALFDVVGDSSKK